MIVAWTLARAGGAASQGGTGSIRGVVYDKDFGIPLAGALVTVVETGQKATSGEQGNYLLPDVAPGRTTLIVSKSGFVRQVRTEVVVSAGRLSEVDVWLAGEFTEMEEFVVQDILQVGAGTETALLAIRFESPALIDSIGSDLMSAAGASDAASALRLVSGTSLQDNKSAVVRGLPDRYVSSQLNGMRLPTANEDKRAVELDQFPASVIESIQVSKTFTPDQQGDASGGAVDVRLRGIPEETSIDFKGQIGWNSQAAGRDDFLTYDGGGINTWGKDDTRVPQLDKLGQSWTGAAGTSEGDSPTDSKWNLSMGGRKDVGEGWTVGGFASVFYERDSSFYDNGQDNELWVDTPGEGMTPQYDQGAPTQGNFMTSMFDVTQASESVQWGALGTLGVQNEFNKLGLTYLYSHTAEDKATLGIDQRGKQFFFPGYDVSDPAHPGNDPDSGILAAPWLRYETLEYTERTTGSVQLHGEHTLPTEGPFGFRNPSLDWTLASSFADQVQPDKRMFGAKWVPFSGLGELWIPAAPGENINLGNFQRVFKSIEEESKSGKLDLKLPFEQWSGEEGYLKFGVFADNLDRTFDQDTFSNLGDSGSNYQGGFDDPWSAVFPSEDHPIQESQFDIDYRGRMDVSAWYSMIDMPLSERFSVIGGARFETTKIGIVNFPEEFAFWVPPGGDSQIGLLPGSGDADVDFEQDDVLPAVALVYRATDTVTLRASYSETVARQTFKELTPILQSEYLGGPIFIGNPELQMSSLRNYDLRADWMPYAGSLLSGSLFYKHIDDPIEYVAKLTSSFDFTTAQNYPEGTLSGIEIEARQELGRLFEPLAKLGTWNLGANATLIESNVKLPQDLIDDFNAPGVLAPSTERDMTNAPEYLFNVYLAYDLQRTGTQLALFYTIQGDTLVEGAGTANGNFVPDVYATTFDSLNFTMTQKLGKHFLLQFQAKNLTNPNIDTVYRSPYIGDDVLKTRESAGIDLSLAIGAKISL